MVAPKHAQEAFGGKFFESIETVNFEPVQDHSSTKTTPSTWPVLKSSGHKYTQTELRALLQEFYEGISNPLTVDAMDDITRRMIDSVKFHDSTADEVRKLREASALKEKPHQTKYAKHQGFRLALTGDHQFFNLRSKDSVFHGRVLGILNNFTSSNARHMRLMSILVELLEESSGQRSIVTLHEFDLLGLSQKREEITEAKLKFEEELTSKNKKNLDLLMDGVFPLKWPHTPYFHSVDLESLTSELPTQWGTTNDEGYQIETFQSDPDVVLRSWDPNRYYYWILDLDGNFRIGPGPYLNSDLPENHLALLANYKPAYLGGYVSKRGEDFFVLIDNQIYSFLSENESDNQHRQFADKVNEIFNLNLGVTIDQVGFQISQPPRHIQSH
jgi:hypothetical protein